jgi:uncharacterized protein DUF4157
MKASAKKSSTTTSSTATQAANQPFFAKANGGNFFAPVTGTAASPIQTKMAVNEPGDKFEQEADNMADKVMRMPAPASMPIKEEELQRQPEDKLQKQEEEKIQKAALSVEKIQKAALPEEKLQKEEEDRVQKAALPEEQVQKQETNETADQVMRMSYSNPPEKSIESDPDTNKVVRMPVVVNQDQLQEDVPAIQRKPKGISVLPSVPRSVSNTINSPGSGSPLNESVRSRVEPVLGADLSNVRVHSGSAAQAASQNLNAKAFTHQSNIFLGRGQSASDVQLMAHESTHVVQQTALPTGDICQRYIGEEYVNSGLEYASDAGDSISEGIDTAVDYGREGVELIGEGVDAVTEAGQEGIIYLVRQVSPGLADFIERGPFTVIRERIEGVMSAWFSALTERISIGDAIEGIKNWFTGAFSGVQGAVAGDEQSCSAFSSILGGLFEFASDIVHSPFVQSVTSGLTKAHDVVAEIVSLYVESNIESLKLIWNGVKAFGDVLSGWINTARRAAGRVWDWVSEQLGLSGDEGTGILDWVKEKASQVWQKIKEDIAPAAFQSFMKVGQVLYQFSGLKAFHDAVQAGRSFITAVTWLWEHRDDPDIVVNAANDPVVKDTILPQILSSARDFGGVVERAVSWVSQQATNLVGLLLMVIGKITGLPILRWAVGFVSSVRESVELLRTWASETLPKVVEVLKKAIARIWKTIKPIVSVVSLLLIGILNPPLLPVVVAGLLGAALWHVLPDCYKPSIINFLLDLAVEALSAMPDLPLFGPLWSLLRPGIISFLKSVRARSDDEKIAVTNKVAKIMLWSGIDFIAGYVWGFLKGIWESLTDAFMMLWMMGKGLFNVTEWLANMGERFFGERGSELPSASVSTTTSPGTQVSTNETRTIHASPPAAVARATGGHESSGVASDRELGGRVMEMAGELTPPAEEVRDNFFDASREYFSGSDGASFDTLREKLGEAWDSAQSTVEGQGQQLGNRVVDALLAPNAEEVGADTAFGVGEFVGWLAGTIVTEVVIAILSAGSVTAAKGVMKVVTAIAKVVDKVGDIFGVVFRLVGRLGKGLFKLLKGAGKMFAGAGRGAIRVVIDALTTIARKLGQFADEILGRIGSRAGREASEEAAERAVREVGEEVGERGVREAGEEASERGVREAGEEAGERGTREGSERGGRDAATEAAEKPVAQAEARGIAEVHDAVNSPVPVVLTHLMSLKGRYRWIETFQARPKGVPGRYSLHMIASDTEIDRDYTTGTESPVSGQQSRADMEAEYRRRIDSATDNIVEADNIRYERHQRRAEAENRPAMDRDDWQEATDRLRENTRRGRIDEDAALESTGIQNNNYAESVAGGQRSPVTYTDPRTGITTRPDGVTDSNWVDVKSVNEGTVYFTDQLRTQMRGAAPQRGLAVVITNPARNAVRPSGPLADAAVVVHRNSATGRWARWSPSMNDGGGGWTSISRSEASSLLGGSAT